MLKIGIVIICLAYLVNVQADIQMVVSLFRHGARRATKYNKYLKDPNFELGVLTGPGMRQLYLVGKYFRYKYSNLINQQYNPNEIYVRSTYEPRTMVSAQSLLLGLYDLGSGPQLPNKDEKFLQYVTTPPSLPPDFPYFQDKYAIPGGFQPVPIHSMPKNIDDFVLKGSKSCNKAEIFQDQRKSDEEMQNMDKKYNSLYQQIQQDLKLESLPKIGEVRKIFSSLLTEYYYNVKGYYQPPQPEQWEQMRFLHDYFYMYSLFGDKNISSLISSQFLESTLQHLKDSKDGKKPQFKMALYSAHDTTVAPVLVALDLVTPECFKEKFETKQEIKGRYCVDFPVFASTLTFELHKQQDNQYEVALIYNGVEYNPCKYNLNNTKCKFEEFEATISKIIMKNVEEICQNVDASDLIVPTKSGTGFKIFLYVALVLINLGFIALFIFLRRKLIYNTLGNYYQTNISLVSKV